LLPIIEARGYQLVAAQNPLTTLVDDVAATKRITARKYRTGNVSADWLVRINTVLDKRLVLRTGSPFVERAPYVLLVRAHSSKFGSMEGKPYIAGPIDADQWLGRISRSPFVVMRLEQILTDCLNLEIASQRA
jgi:hypothetical protein